MNLPLYHTAKPLILWRDGLLATDNSFRRANITWRQEVGGSAIEASKIAGHANVSMTGDYTIVQLQRQDELTRAIQSRMANGRKKKRASTPANRSPPRKS